MYREEKNVPQNFKQDSKYKKKFLFFILRHTQRVRTRNDDAIKENKNRVSSLNEKIIKKKTAHKEVVYTSKRKIC